MKTKGNLNLISLLLVCVMLTACSRVGEQATSTPVPPSALPSASNTPSNTATPTMRPTATWVPPLPAAEAEAKVIELLQDNGGCRLPCFMGIMPGETTAEILRTYMYQFVNIRRGGLYLSGSDSEIRIFFSVQPSEGLYATIPSMEVTMSNNDPRHGNYSDYVFDDPLFVEYFQYYALPSLITNYGRPSEVFVGLAPGEMGSDDILHLILDYPEQGWRVDYWMPFQRDGFTISACSSQAFVALAVWEPGNSVAAQVSSRWIERSVFRPIEQATDLGLEEFYQLFKDSNNLPCIETQAEVWPWYYEYLQNQAE